MGEGQGERTLRQDFRKPLRLRKMGEGSVAEVIQKGKEVAELGSSLCQAQCQALGAMSSLNPNDNPVRAV